MRKTRSKFHRPDSRQDALSSNIAQSIKRTLDEGRLRTLDTSAGDDFAALVVERSSSPRAPAWMAEVQSGDAAERKTARASYERCLEIYRTVVRPQDTTFDDAGAALAFFVAINLNALHDVPTTSENLLLLERQLIGVARQASGWDTASISQRQFYFEQMAMLGVFVAGLVSQARSEGATSQAKVNKAARAYLRRVLGVDPDRLIFGLHGLSVRPASGPAHSAAR